NRAVVRRGQDAVAVRRERERVDLLRGTGESDVRPLPVGWEDVGILPVRDDNAIVREEQCGARESARRLELEERLAARLRTERVNVTLMALLRALDVHMGGDSDAGTVGAERGDAPQPVHGDVRNGLAGFRIEDANFGCGRGERTP